MSVDSENFYLDCEVRITAVLSCKKAVNCLLSSEINPDTKVQSSACLVNVYYPTQGDSLFGIAKEFKTSVRKIAESNALTEKTVSLAGECNLLDSVKKLVIVKM